MELPSDDIGTDGLLEDGPIGLVDESSSHGGDGAAGDEDELGEELGAFLLEEVVEVGAIRFWHHQVAEDSVEGVAIAEEVEGVLCAVNLVDLEGRVEGSA